MLVYQPPEQSWRQGGRDVLILLFLVTHLPQHCRHIQSLVDCEKFPAQNQNKMKIMGKYGHLNVGKSVSQCVCIYMHTSNLSIFIYSSTTVLRLSQII